MFANCMHIRRNDAKAETPVIRPPHAKSWLIGKDSDAGRDWGQEEKGTSEDEMAGWHHGHDGRESEWTSGVGDGQGGLACCDSWGRKESDTTERLNWTKDGPGFPYSSKIPLTPQILLMGPRSHFPPEGQSELFIGWSAPGIRVNLSIIGSIIQAWTCGYIKERWIFDAGWPWYSLDFRENWLKWNFFVLKTAKLVLLAYAIENL